AFATLAVSCGKIFVVGGYNHIEGICRKLLTSVEMYDPETDSWEKKASMACKTGDLIIGTLPVPASLLSLSPNFEASSVDTQEVQEG
ncbi:hypothetical protein PENTCL1PPCAC_27107, partial [Pristionchus entomophagus]